MTHCYFPRAKSQKTHLANKARARASLILQPPENSLKTERAASEEGVHQGRQGQSQWYSNTRMARATYRVGCCCILGVKPSPARMTDALWVKKLKNPVGTGNRRER